MDETCVVIKSIYRKLDSERFNCSYYQKWPLDVEPGGPHSLSASNGENKILLHCRERNPISPVVQPVA